MSGAVDLPTLEQPPEPLWGLITGTDARSREFRQGIRQYNSAFNMASSTAKVERRFPTGVQAFRINGVVHHPGDCLHTALPFCCFFALVLIRCHQSHVPEETIFPDDNWLHGARVTEEAMFPR